MGRPVTAVVRPMPPDRPFTQPIPSNPNPFNKQVEVTRRREREGSSPPSSILFCSTHVIDEDGVAAIAGEAVVMLVHKDKGEGK